MPTKKIGRAGRRKIPSNEKIGRKDHPCRECRDILKEEVLPTLQRALRAGAKRERQMAKDIEIIAQAIRTYRAETI